MKESLHYLSISLTIISLIGAIYRYNENMPPLRAKPELLKTDSLLEYNIKVYKVLADTTFAQSSAVKVYIERNLRELPLKFLRDYAVCSFTHTTDSVLTIGVKKSQNNAKIDTFRIVLPDSFPKRITLDMMHQFHKIETE